MKAGARLDKQKGQVNSQPVSHRQAAKKTAMYKTCFTHTERIIAKSDGPDQVLDSEIQQGATYCEQEENITSGPTVSPSAGSRSSRRHHHPKGRPSEQWGGQLARCVRPSHCFLLPHVGLELLKHEGLKY